MLAQLARDLAEARGVKLDASEAAIEALLDLGGFDPELGARPMRRAIGRFVEAPIAEMLLKSELSRGDVATVDAEDGSIVVDAVTPSAATRLAIESTRTARVVSEGVCVCYLAHAWRGPSRSAARAVAWGGARSASRARPATAPSATARTARRSRASSGSRACSTIAAARTSSRWRRRSSSSIKGATRSDACA